MDFIFAWVMFSLAVGVYATEKGESFWRIFFASLVASPLIMFAAIAPSPQIDSVVDARAIKDGTAKKCDMCAEMVRPEAKVCRFCGNKFAS